MVRDVLSCSEDMDCLSAPVTFLLTRQHDSVVVHLIESAGRILILSTPTRVVGLLFSGPPPVVVGVSPILPKTSSPFINRPNAVYWWSKDLASPKQMKN